jgi:hypothetical protein
MSKEKKSKAAKSETAANEEPVHEEAELQALEVQAPKIQEPKRQEIKLQETKRPGNLRADAMPVDGYVLSIDGKLKKRYESAQEAMAAGTALKQRYPVIQVAVYNAAERDYTPVEPAAPEK